MIALNTPALIIGWAFMLAGGVLLAAAAIGVALDMMWGKLKATAQPKRMRTITTGYSLRSHLPFSCSTARRWGHRGWPRPDLRARVLFHNPRMRGHGVLSRSGHKNSVASNMQVTRRRPIRRAMPLLDRCGDL